MTRKILKNTEWGILICAILLIIIGLVALYSTSIASNLDVFKKQSVWVFISIPVIVLLMLIDYNIIVKFSPYLYGLTAILLIAVLFTTAINGASSWFAFGSFSFQPGEMGKIVMVLFLSYIFTIIQKNQKDNINKIRNILLIISIVMVFVVLLAIQPDYGTAIAYIISLVLMLFVAGIDKKYIIVSILLIAVLLPLMYFYILPDHAKSRIDVYLNPELDPRGAGYNIIQSKLAIGAGKLFGMGLLQGTQTHLGFLYPKTTDFIFSAIGEELGFIVCRGYCNNLCYIDY